MLDHLLFDSSDLLLSVVLFLDPFDARQVAAISKAHYEALTSEFLWLQYLQMRVPGFAHLSSEDICTLQALLCIRNKYKMYFRFRKMSFPLFGYYRSECDFGKLFCIKAVDGGVVCRPITTDDEEIDEFPGFEFTYNNVEMSHLSMCQEKAKIDKDSLLFTFECKRTLKLLPVPPLCNLYPSVLNGCDVVKQLESAKCVTLVPQLSAVVGLSVAEYGPHGVEILHLSIQSPCDTEHNVFAEPVAMLSRWRLCGLKVTGDRNVPNGKVSFSIDLSSTIDIQQEIQHDRRPLVFISATGSYRQEFVHSALTRAAGWFRGKGQINKVPDSWQPEWIDCSFMVYNTPREYSGAVGVLIWEALEQNFRHALEIFPMTRSNAEMRAGFSYSRL